MTDTLKKLDCAMVILMELWSDTKATEIADTLSMLSAYREDYIKDNGQFGMGG